MESDTTARTAHTPGPWHVWPTGRIITSDVGDHEVTLITSPEHAANPLVLVMDEINEHAANAHLIAAAPAMLAALEEFIAAWERAPEMMSGDQMSAFYGALAAIRTARGDA